MSVQQNTTRKDNGDLYMGDQPFQTMDGRWTNGRTDALNYSQWYTWRNHDGSIRDVPDILPSIDAMGSKVARAYEAWSEAQSDYELAKSNVEAVNHPDAMKRAEQRDAQRVVQIALQGGDHVKAADESPEVDKLKRNRKVYAGDLAKTEGPLRLTKAALIKALNDTAEQQAAVQRVVTAKREADAKLAEAHAVLASAEARSKSADHDLLYTCEWANVRASDVMGNGE